MKLGFVLTCLIAAIELRAQVVRDHTIIKNPRAGIVYWPASEQEAKQLTREQVDRLLQHTNSDEAKDGSFLKDYLFAPLEPNKMYLVAVVDINGRQYYEEILIMFCDDKSCTQDGLYSRLEIDLVTQVVSIPGSGLMQIITQQVIGAVAVGGMSIYHIYEMTKDGPVEVSAKYHDWYKEHILPELEAQRKQASDPDFVNPDPNPPTSAEDQIAIRSAQAQYALDEYRERVLGIKDAPMEHALNWAKSLHFEVNELASLAVRNAADSKLADEVLRALEDAHAKITSDSARAAIQDVDRAVRKEREDLRQKKIEDRQ